MTNNVLADLVELLGLEKIEENLFRGQSRDLGWGVVFGGQVLGQALSAALQTVPAERHVHSLHTYFLRPGNVSKPIVYEVDRVRDGGSFTTRRVQAIQSGEVILTGLASFHVDEVSIEHQDKMPDVPPPEECQTEQDRMKKTAHVLTPLWRERAAAPQPFEIRWVGPEDPDPLNPAPKPAYRPVWMKATGRLADDPALHRYLLAYISDSGLITTALMPHGIAWLGHGMHIASLDHAMWFHQPFRVDEWLLYVRSSPQAFGARGLAQGSIFTQDGRLVASVMQEGLLRKRKPKA